MGRRIVLAALLLAMALSATTAAAQAPRVWKPATMAAAKPRGPRSAAGDCTAACDATFDLGLNACANSFAGCISNAGGDPDLEQQCRDAQSQCVAATTLGHQTCLANCPPPSCSETCDQTYQAALAIYAANHDACIAGAGGDPDLTAVCDAQYASGVAGTDANHVACLTACGPTPNRHRSWGQVKAIYR